MPMFRKESRIEAAPPFLSGNRLVDDPMERRWKSARMVQDGRFALFTV
jgi:hypothetical protein